MSLSGHSGPKWVGGPTGPLSPNVRPSTSPGASCVPIGGGTTCPTAATTTTRHRNAIYQKAALCRPPSTAVQVPLM